MKRRIRDRSLASRSRAFDRRFWFHGAWICQAGQGTRRICQYPPSHAGARTALYGLVEILGGLAVILGAFVALASVPMAAVLLVAMFTVHLPYGFSSIKLTAITATGAQFGPPGYEVDLLYLACLAALVLGGPGPLAIDGLIRRRRKVRASQSTPNLTAVG
jgi:uncharacterized membrane protein YphA (DoxX/SURF4 family)